MISPTLSDGISQIMTGNSDSGSKCLTKSTESFIGCKINLNLTATQSVMGIMNSIDTADDPSLEEKVDRMRWFAGIGTAGPAIVAGTMLIVYRIAMALFIGFAPIFILSLLFKKTAPLFQKWLYYGLATVFSSALLAVMADISMNLVGNISGALFVSNSAVELLTGTNASGVMHSVTQQLGLGLILSTLLIVVPPMAGMWFNGMMGHFNAYSPLSDRWNAGGGGTVPPHMDGGLSYQQQVENKVQYQYEQVGKKQDTTYSGNTSDVNSGFIRNLKNNSSTDVMGFGSQLRYGEQIRTPQPPAPKPKQETEL